MTERTELFRPEILQSRIESRFGTPLYHQHSLLRGSVLLCIVLVIVLLTLLVITPYKETEPARGVLVSSQGAHKVVAPVTAVVQHIEVSPGDSVRRGQVLATLLSATFSADGSQVERQQTEQLDEQRHLLQQQLALQSELYERQHQQLGAAIDELEIARDLIDGEGVLLQQQLQLKTTSLAAMKELQRSGAISKSQLEFAEVEQLDFQLRVQNAEQRLQELTVRQNSHQAQLDNLALEFSETRLQLQKELQQVQRTIEQLELQSHLAVVAEADGIVTALAVAKGEAVRASQPLVYIDSDADQLEATLFVSSSVIGQVFPGQELLLNYDAFNSQFYGRYRATVTQIDKASLDPREHLLPVPGIQEPVFSIRATLAQAYVEGPDIYRLQAGMFFSADIVTAEMSLMALIFRPVIQLHSRLV